MTRLLSVSSSRADLGILAPVWRALAASPGIEIHLLLTGAHARDEDLAAEAVLAGAVIHRGGADLAGRSAGEAATAMAEIAGFAARVVEDTNPDGMLLTGDRLDMIPAALATLAHNLPLVHLHGGEITRGAIDERIRHALTKLAHLHCVATVEAAERLCRMGEEPWRICVTGAPGLDSLRAQPIMAAAELAHALGFESVDGLCLVTVHPETNAIEPARPLDAVLAALDRLHPPCVLTAPNADPGAAAMRARIESFAAERPWAVFRANLGMRLYANVLRRASLMLGNSSSGIVEAGLYALPVIDVGARQAGRAHDANVDHVPAEPDAIVRAFAEHVQPPCAPREVRACLYGDGRAAPRIAAFVAEALDDRERLLVKGFATEVPCFAAPWQDTPGAARADEAAVAWRKRTGR